VRPRSQYYFPNKEPTPGPSTPLRRGGLAGQEEGRYFKTFIFLPLRLSDSTRDNFGFTIRIFSTAKFAKDAKIRDLLFFVLSPANLRLSSADNHSDLVIRIFYPQITPITQIIFLFIFRTSAAIRVCG
jgi:hypothetical protein